MHVVWNSLEILLIRVGKLLLKLVRRVLCMNFINRPDVQKTFSDKGWKVTDRVDLWDGIETMYSRDIVYCYMTFRIKVYFTDEDFIEVIFNNKQTHLFLTIVPCEAIEDNIVHKVHDLESESKYSDYIDMPLLFDPQSVYYKIMTIVKAKANTMLPQKNA